MYYISHRGNLKGSKPEYENHPNYIKKALSMGYDVEIDVWYISCKKCYYSQYPNLPKRSNNPHKKITLVIILWDLVPLRPLFEIKKQIQIINDKEFAN